MATQESFWNSGSFNSLPSNLRNKEKLTRAGIFPNRLFGIESEGTLLMTPTNLKSKQTNKSPSWAVKDLLIAPEIH